MSRLAYLHRRALNAIPHMRMRYSRRLHVDGMHVWRIDPYNWSFCFENDYLFDNTFARRAHKHTNTHAQTQSVIVVFRATSSSIRIFRLSWLLPSVAPQVVYGSHSHKHIPMHTANECAHTQADKRDYSPTIAPFGCSCEACARVRVCDVCVNYFAGDNECSVAATRPSVSFCFDNIPFSFGRRVNTVLFAWSDLSVVHAYQLKSSTIDCKRKEGSVVDTIIESENYIVDSVGFYSICASIGVHPLNVFRELRSCSNLKKNKKRGKNAALIQKIIICANLTVFCFTCASASNKCEFISHSERAYTIRASLFLCVWTFDDLFLWNIFRWPPYNTRKINLISLHQFVRPKPEIEGEKKKRYFFWCVRGVNKTDSTVSVADATDGRLNSIRIKFIDNFIGSFR